MALCNSREVLIAFGALVHSMGATAQVDFGVKGGVNYNAWSPIEFNWYQIGTYPPASYSGIGFHLGGLITAPLSAKLAFQCELLYSVRDVRNEMDATITYFDGFVDHTQRVHGSDEFTLGYLDMPLVFCLRAGHHMGLQLGPVVGFRLHSQRKGAFTTEETFSGSTTTDQYSDDPSGQVISKSVDLAIAAGVTYAWDDGLELGLRYARSFTTTVVPGNPVYWSDTGDGIHQNVFQFSVAYWFTKR